jgi:four helix bundle protein
VKRRHRDLRVWQEAMKLVEEIYRITGSFPKDELFGLTSQMRRAVVSIPSNIAEGAARSGTRELLQFVRIADASLSELDTQIEIASRLGLLPDRSKIDDQIECVSALLAGLCQSLRRKA